MLLPKTSLGHKDFLCLGPSCIWIIFDLVAQKSQEAKRKCLGPAWICLGATWDGGMLMAGGETGWSCGPFPPKPFSLQQPLPMEAAPLPWQQQVLQVWAPCGILDMQAAAIWVFVAITKGTWSPRVCWSKQSPSKRSHTSQSPLWAGWKHCLAHWGGKWPQ